jgi:hypothetical protein
MSHRRVKWSDVDRYFTARGYEIQSRKSGDKFIVAPKGAPGTTRNTCRIGHKCCSNPGDELYDCYLSAIKRFFNVTVDDILG